MKTGITNDTNAVEREVIMDSKLLIVRYGMLDLIESLDAPGTFSTCTITAASCPAPSNAKGLRAYC